MAVKTSIVMVLIVKLQSWDSCNGSDSADRDNEVHISVIAMAIYL